MLFTFQSAVLRCGFLSRQSNSYGQENNTITTQHNNFCLPSPAGFQMVHFFAKPFYHLFKRAQAHTKTKPGRARTWFNQKEGKLGETHKVWIKDQIPPHNRTRAIGWWYLPYKSPVPLWNSVEALTCCFLRQTLLRYLCNKPLANCFSFSFFA